MSTTDTIELQQPRVRYEDVSSQEKKSHVKTEESPAFAKALSQDTELSTNLDDDEPPRERWNESRINMFRTFASFWAFVVMGMNDGAIGALLPYLQEYYHVSYALTSVLFLSPFLGYTVAALSNNTIHHHLGRRGIAFMAPVSKMIAYVVVCVHPPYPVAVVFYMFAGFGNGLEDSAWNAWIGPMENANEVLGFLHGCYGLGATLAPLIATSMITKGNLPWYTFYYILIGCAAIEFATSVPAFFACTAAVHRSENATADAKTNNRMSEALATLPAARVTWLCALFLCCYVGIEVAVGGWVVTFALRVRHGSAFASGMTATGFWLGITVGRVTLGFVTGRIGERLAISIYLLFAIGCHLCFWLIPSFLASAIFVSFLGFSLAPLFPGAIVAATALLPKHLHVSAIGFAAAVGGGGAAVFPFAVGAIAQKAGVSVLMPIVLALLIVDLALWLALPRRKKRKSTSVDGGAESGEKLSWKTKIEERVRRRGRGVREDPVRSP